MLRKLTLSLFFGTVLLAGDAMAQNVRQLLAKGNQLFATGRYAEAFEVYKQGQGKSPVFLRSMAFCKMKLSRHKEAQALLDKYVKKHPKAKDLQKVRSTLKDLEVIVQTRVSITSTPPGAAVFFDLEGSGRVGTTPFEGTIEPGRHTVILKHPGYVDAERDFTIAAKKSVSLDLAMGVGLTVTSSPTGAEVHVGTPDSPAVGKTPYRGSIPPGEQKIYVRLTGYKSYEQALTIAKGPVNVDAKLQLGMRIDSVPAGAVVEIDGTRVEGQTPLEIAKPPGNYSVTITLPGFKPFTQQLTVAAGQSNAVAAKMAGGLLSMRTGPDGAAVTVGQYKLGSTPLDRIPVPMGTQKVVIRHPDRRVWRGAFDFNENKLLTADIKLGRSAWPAWTSAGLATAGLVLGIVGAVVAKGRVDYADKPRYDAAGDLVGQGYCQEDGTAYEGVYADDTGNSLISPTCGYGFHHISTAGFITAGTAGIFSLLYYWFAVRPDEQVATAASATTASR